MPIILTGPSQLLFLLDHRQHALFDVWTLPFFTSFFLKKWPGKKKFFTGAPPSAIYSESASKTETKIFFRHMTAPPRHMTQKIFLTESDSGPPKTGFPIICRKKIFVSYDGPPGPQASYDEKKFSSQFSTMIPNI